MSELANFGAALGKPLNQRRQVTVQLPEFLIRAISYRVEEANLDAPDDECVEFNDEIEWLLVSEVSVRRVPLLEESIPGFAAAMATWLMNSTYGQQEED
jgi:hypothetical protein